MTEQVIDIEFWSFATFVQLVNNILLGHTASGAVVFSQFFWSSAL